MKNEDFCELIFRKTLLLEGELLNLLKKTPKIAPPPRKEREKKKNPKHLKCSLTRAKDESHKRVDSSSLLLSLSVSLSLSLSLSVCPPLDNHEIYHKISLNFNIQQSWTLTKLKLKIKKSEFFFFIIIIIFFFFFFFFFFTTAYTWEAACCTCESCGLTLKIASSIGELLLLIYKSGFYR